MTGLFKSINFPMLVFSYYETGRDSVGTRVILKTGTNGVAILLQKP